MAVNENHDIKILQFPNIGSSQTRGGRSNNLQDGVHTGRKIHAGRQFEKATQIHHRWKQQLMADTSAVWTVLLYH